MRRLLPGEPDLEIVGEAADGAELIGVLEACPADVAVLDLSLPHLQGLERVQLVRQSSPQVGLVIFTMQRHDVLGRSLVGAGILGYVRKDRPPSELVRAVRRAARGQQDLPPGLSGPTQPAGDGLPHSALSPREAQVFHRLAAGIPVKDIAHELEISASTASNHVAGVREKLGLRTNGEVVLYALRHGLVG